MIRAIADRISNIGRRLARNERGAAAVEFALILPVMLTLYIGTLEASALISTDRRVQVVNGTIGDLVARANKEIRGTTLLDYFRAAENILSPYSTATLEQTVTLVAVAANGTTAVRWSRRYTAGASNHVTGHTTGSAFTLPAETIAVARGSFVIVSETRYTYTPLLGLIMPADFPLGKQNFYSPRFGTEIVYLG
jgi:Flp pilus assembly protein TadG